MAEEFLPTALMTTTLVAFSVMAERIFGPLMDTLFMKRCFSAVVVAVVAVVAVIVVVVVVVGALYDADRNIRKN